VFDQWVQDSNGKLLVATIDRQPVGILHAVFLGNGVAWLEGMRVHPDFRRRGIGTATDIEARQMAREHGCRVARLATSTKNIAAQKTLDTEGYHRAALFNEWETEPAQEGFPALRVGTETDLANSLTQWRASEMCQASHTILPDRHWHWTTLDETRLRAHLTANEMRIILNGFALVAPLDEPDWNGLTIQALAGDDDAMFILARAVRGEAAYRGYANVQATLANYPPLNAALERAGYHSDGGLYIYEQNL
jgi:hypothetical protein